MTKPGNFSGCCLRTDQHAVAAAFIGRLDDKVSQIVQNILTVGLHSGKEGFHVRQDGFFAEVKFDHGRHVVIDDLVIGYSGADRIGQTHIAFAVSLDQAGHTKKRIRSEYFGIEEVVVNPPINDVHRLESLRRLHKDAVVLHQKVRARDNLDSHGPGEKGVLEISGVVDARAKQDRGRIARRAGWRHVVEDVDQVLRVTVDRTHPVPGEQLRKNALHGHAALQNIGDAGRTTGVVFENQIATVPVADQVGPAHVDVNVPRDIEAHEFRTEMLRAADDFLGNNPFLHDALLMVDVVEKGIQRVETLFEAPLNVTPFVTGNDTRHEIERKNAFRALLLVVVDRKGDPLVQIGPLGDLALAVEVLDGKGLGPLQQHPVVRTNHTRRREHLIVKIARVIVLEKGRHRGLNKISREHEMCHLHPPWPAVKVRAPSAGPPARPAPGRAPRRATNQRP